jgi:hypothetical protein
MHDILERVSEDKPIYGIVAAYLGVAVMLSLHLADFKWFVPFMYIGRWLLFASMMIAIYFGCLALASQSPFSTFRTAGIQFWRARGSGLVLFVFMAIFQGTFTSIKVMMPELVPFSFDPILADFDERMHFGAPWEYLRFLDPYTTILRQLYTPVWVTLVMLSVLLACLSQPGTLRTQFLLTYMLCWVLLGNVLAMAFMSAGPIYYENLLGDARFAVLTSHLHTVSSPDEPLSQIPDLLWTAYVTKTPGIATGISAFPSLHLSITTLFLLVSFRLRRWLGWMTALYLCVIMAGSVHLGWHYAIDGYVSIAGTIVLWMGVGLWLRRDTRATEPVIAVSHIH